MIQTAKHPWRDRIANISRCVVITLCSATALGWMTGTLVLASLLPSKIPMAPSTALLFILLVLPKFVTNERYHRFVQLFSGSIAGVLAFIAFVRSIVEFEWESILFNQPALFQGVPLGRMSPLTIVTFLFAATAVLISVSRIRYSQDICVVSAGVVVVIGSVVAIGYVYNTPILYGGDIVPMALSTGIAFVALGLGIIVVDGHDSRLFLFVSGNRFRARLIKLFLPSMVGLALLQGWLAQVLLPTIGIQNPALAASLAAIGNGAFVAALCVTLSHRIGNTFDRSIDERNLVESALRKGRMLLNETQQIAKVGGWEFDPLTMQGTWTEETARIHGLDPSHSPSVELGLSFFHGEHRRRIEAAVREAIDLGKPFDLELELVTAQGECKWVRSVGFPQIQDGRIVRVKGMIQDITDRKQAEKALWESEQRLRLALWAANQGLYDLNVQTGVAVVNDEYALMLDYDPAAFVETNEKWIERLHPDDRESVAEMYRAYIRGDIQEYRVEFRQRTRTGDWKWILSRGSIVEWDAEGRPLRMLGTHTDITERKQVEEALQNERDTAQQYLDIAGVMIAALDRNGRIALINKKGCEILGYEESELINRNWFDCCISVGERDQLLEVFNRLLKKEVGSLVYFENSVVTKSGEERLIAFHNIVIQDKASNVTGVLFSGEDITDRLREENQRKQLEAQLYQAQKMEAVGRLAGGVAHDFNNMLNVILGYTELVLQRIGPENPLAADLHEVINAARRSVELTGQLLAFARKQVVAPKIVNLNTAIANLEKMLRRLIGEDIELQLIQGNELGNILIDPTQIDQIIANLAVNSRDAIRGTGKITIETANVVLDEFYCSNHPGFIPGEFVMIAFTDNGCGMARSTIDKIFEPFFTTKEKGKGTGLGLAMVYGIVKQNGGFINVYSEPEMGTTFKIYFPIVREEVVEIETKSDRPLYGTETILVVEDEVQVRQLAKVMLEKFGYNVLDAVSPEEAVALCERYEEEIHLLLTDVVMPGMNGKELQMKIESIKPGIQAVFMSGYTEDIVAHRGILQEGTYFIQKPFSLRTLSETVRAALDRS